MNFSPPNPSCSNENFCFHVGDYSFGFNGKELDKEGMGGGASTYDYGFRIYNSALGKFLSVDPLSASYPWYSPYQFAGNMPIWAIDIDGLEELKVTGTFEKLVAAYSDAFKAAWKASFITEEKRNGKQKEKVVEYGGVLIHKVEKNELGEVVTDSYEVINAGTGSKGSFETDYKTGITEEMEIIGDFHTHPYSQEEIEDNQRLYPNFDGKGATFSSGDFISFSQNQDLSAVGLGDIHFVVAGDVIYGLEITDVESAKKLMSNDQFLLDVDYMDTDMPKEGDFGDQSFANLKALVEKYGGEEACGIKLHQQKLDCEEEK